MSEQSDARLPLSVLVPVKNEAANLPGCIASVSFAQEIVVAIPLPLCLEARFS
jgi:hypothetical protein